MKCMLKVTKKKPDKGLRNEESGYLKCTSLFALGENIVQLGHNIHDTGIMEKETMQ